MTGRRGGQRTSAWLESSRYCCNRGAREDETEFRDGTPSSRSAAAAFKEADLDEGTSTGGVMTLSSMSSLQPTVLNSAAAAAEGGDACAAWVARPA